MGVLRLLEESLRHVVHHGRVRQPDEGAGVSRAAPRRLPRRGMNTPRVDLPGDRGRSWWLQEALAADPGEPCLPLLSDTHADVVILGGGYTGMWTAYFL